MKNWLPFNSSDPAANAAVAVFLAFIAIMLIVVGGMFLLPIVLIIAIAKGIHWYTNLPTPTDQLYAQTEQRKIEANFPDTAKFVDAYIDRFLDAIRNDLPAYNVFLAFAHIAQALYEDEGFTNPLPPIVSSTQIEEGRYRDQLIDHQRKSVDAPRTLETITKTIGKASLDFVAMLPGMAKASPEEFAKCGELELFATIPLIDLLPNVGRCVSRLTLPFLTEDVIDIGLFAGLRHQLDRNLNLASGERAKHIPPDEYKGTPREIVSTYLYNTPFEDLFDVPIPFSLPEETRFSGMWCIAPPGRGKTTLLHTMVMDDLKKDAAIILMDSKGDLIEPFRNLKQIEDRLIIVDPNPDRPIAINPLDIPKTDISLAVSNLEYVFSSLLEFKMTPLQTVLFRSILRALILNFPNPTLETFRDILANGVSKYAAYIKQLPQDLQDFFANEFNTKVYEDRRKEIIWRIRLLLENDTMRSMMLALRTRFNIADAMDSGKIVIINNSKARLGDQGAEFFGRFFIAQVLAAAQQRAGRSAMQRKPVYFYIDECQNVIARDERIPTILDECRSQKVALILAHQRTEQISSQNVLSALSNCAIRYANSDDEARFLAAKLRTTPEFLQRLKRGQFAAYVRDMTTTAIALDVPRTDFAAHPKLTPDEQRALMAKMQAQYGVPPPRAHQPPASPPPTAPPPSKILPVTTPEPPADKAASPRPVVGTDEADSW